MLQIGMIVKILPDAEYSGKFTGSSRTGTAGR